MTKKRKKTGKTEKTKKTKKTKAKAGREKISTRRPKVARAKTFGKKDLQFFEKLLVGLMERISAEMRLLEQESLGKSQRELAGDLSGYSFHMADVGTDNYERELSLGLVGSEQDSLHEVEEALARVRDGIYGLCEGCGVRITRRRLVAVPHAKFCNRCQSQTEGEAKEVSGQSR